MIKIMINHFFFVHSQHCTWCLVPGTSCTDEVFCNAQRTTQPRLTLGWARDSGLSGMNRMYKHCLLVGRSCREVETGQHSTKPVLVMCNQPHCIRKDRKNRDTGCNPQVLQSSPSITPTRTVAQEHGTEQMLPVTSASSFPLWVIEKDDSGRQQIVQVPTASEAGWVDPRRYRCHHGCCCALYRQ